ACAVAEITRTPSNNSPLGLPILFCSDMAMYLRQLRRSGKVMQHFLTIVVLLSTVVKILLNPGHPVSQFDPSYAFGAAIDGHEKGELNQMLARENVSKMLSAGLKPISYR